MGTQPQMNISTHDVLNSILCIHACISHAPPNNFRFTPQFVFFGVFFVVIFILNMSTLHIEVPADFLKILYDNLVC